MRTPYKPPRRKPYASYDRLEGRRLLAGNVGVFLSGSTLVVEGDQLANQIDVAQTANGDVVFTGRDSTTINGQDEFTFTQAFNRSRFALNDGADDVVFNGFEGGNEFRFLGGDGDDRLVANSVTARYFHIRGNAGDDSVQLVQSSSRRSSHFHLGGGDDTVSVVSFTAERNFRIFGARGNDTFTSNSLDVGRKFRINLGSGNDQALISGETNVGRSAKFRLGSGNDFLGVLPELNGAEAVFQKHAAVRAGRGDDTVVIGDSNRFERNAKFNGQSGLDSIELGQSEFDRRSIVRRFESQSVSNLNVLLDQVFETLDDLDFDSTQFGNNAQLAETSIEVEIPSTDVTFVENDAPVEVFSDLVLEAISTENIASATIGLQGGDSSDLLSIEDQNGIAGSFDAEQSILTLTGNSSASQYQAAIRTILFGSLGDNPSDGTRTATLSIQSELPFAPIIVSRDIQVTAVDDLLDLQLPQSFASGTTVQPVNQAFQFVFEDPDPDNQVSYRLDLEQSGIPVDASQPTIDALAGALSWIPSEVGTFLLRVIATNDLGETDQEEFSVVVEE